MTGFRQAPVFKMVIRSYWSGFPSKNQKYFPRIRILTTKKNHNYLIVNILKFGTFQEG